MLVAIEAIDAVLAALVEVHRSGMCDGEDARVVDRLCRCGRRWIPWGDDAVELERSIPAMRERIAAAGGSPDDLQVVANLRVVKTDDGAIDLARTMEAVPRHVMADPLFALELLVLIIVLSCVLIGLSALVFMRAGIDRGLVIGLLAAFRNIGVVMAALGSALPDMAWFYFAMAQFPIYLLPALVKPLARRFAQREAAKGA